jgi:hypothetical protein
MGRIDLASLNGQAQRSRTDPEDTSGFVQIHPSFRGASIAIVTSDAVMRAERGDSFSSPAIPTPSEESIAIEDVRQEIIRADPRQRAHGVDDIF